MPTINIAKPSVQSLLISMSVNGNPLSTGTGFICLSKKAPMLITNWHNLTGRHPETKQPLSPTGGLPDAVHIIHNRKGRLGYWTQTVEPLKTSRWIEHPRYGEKVDVVALPLTDLTDVELYPYDVMADPDIIVRPAETISVVGFPLGLQAGGSLAVWATGFVASEPDIDFRDLPLFLVDCRTRPGQSGSAVIFHSNGGVVRYKNGNTSLQTGETTRLLGVYSGRVSAESDIGMVWKSAAIAEIVSAA
ncbi:MAG: trypsin-like peptidase domain-containing protein [Proteobacteria bacterium]|nr:trypsin-like peptidase domain-containing protein [Pseudomonadota bacterium]